MLSTYIWTFRLYLKLRKYGGAPSVRINPIAFYKQYKERQKWVDAATRKRDQLNKSKSWTEVFILYKQV